MGRDAKFVVRLSLEEEGLLRGLISTGKRTASVLSRARILLKADAGATGGGPSDAAVADAVESSVSTVHRTRQAFVEQGLEAALYRKKPTGRQYRKLDGAQEAPGGPDPGTAPDSARTTGAAGLRIRALRHGQLVLGDRALGRPAADQGDPAAHGGGLCRVRARHRGPLVSRRPEDRAGHGQFEHA